MTPLGRALKDAVAEMNISEDLDKKIQHEFERAIEQEFAIHNQNHSGKVSAAAHRYKLTGHCKTYNNVYRVWNFNIERFEANLEDKKIKSEVECKLISIPH